MAADVGWICELASIAAGSAEAHAQPQRGDAVLQARSIARELWRPPEAPVLDDDQLRAIDALVARAQRG